MQGSLLHRAPHQFGTCREGRSFAYIRAGAVVAPQGVLQVEGYFPVCRNPRQLLLQICLSVYGLEDCGYQRPRQILVLTTKQYSSSLFWCPQDSAQSHGQSGSYIEGQTTEIGLGGRR